MERKRRKKILSVIFLSLILITGLAGCKTEKLDQHTDHKQQEQAKQEKTEDDFFDVESAEGEVDYSKYEKDDTQSIKGEVEVSDGTGKEQDQYQTDPVPEGKQMPVEPGEVKIDRTKEKTCYLTISCHTILNNMDQLTKGKESLVPSNGILLPKTEVVFYEGESVFDILKRETKKNRIHMESNFTPMYNSAYIKGIGNLYEFDCGSNSGWMYSVNGWYPNYGVSRYAVQDQDNIQFNYTCDLGRDLY